MPVFQIHEGRLRVGDVQLGLAEYQALRPEQPLPQVPEGVVTCRYDSATGTVVMSDGHRQFTADFDSNAANIILADPTLAADLAAYRLENTSQT